jgi:hypothetical protein
VTTVEVVERAGIGAKRRLARRATARRGHPSDGSRTAL